MPSKLIENVKLKKTVLVDMGYPIEIVKSVVGKLRISVPWKSIQTSSTIVEISDISV